MPEERFKQFAIASRQAEAPSDPPNIRFSLPVHGPARLDPDTQQIGPPVEWFSCKRGNLPAAVAQMLSGHLPNGETGTVMDGISFALIPEDVDRFWRVISDQRNSYEAGDLQPVFAWIIEQYTDRPTSQPSNATNGQAPTGSGSTAGVPSTE